MQNQLLAALLSLHAKHYEHHTTDQRHCTGFCCGSITTGFPQLSTLVHAHADNALHSTLWENDKKDKAVLQPTNVDLPTPVLTHAQQGQEK